MKGFDVTATSENGLPSLAHVTAAGGTENATMRAFCPERCTLRLRTAAPAGTTSA